MEKFNSVELLYRSIRSMAVEGESTVLGTAHAPNRSIRSNRPNSFKWKLGFKDTPHRSVVKCCSKDGSRASWFRISKQVVNGIHTM